MARILLIKDANTAQKEVDDIVGFYEDDHRFNPWDMNVIFSQLQVKGYTREQLVEFALNKRPKMQRIYKLTKANKWTAERPQKETAWKYTDGKWYMLAKEPKYLYSIKNMTTQEKDILSSELSTIFDKLNALGHLECKIAMDAKNLVEITELNT